MRKKTKVTDDLEFYSVLRSIRSIESSDVCILMIDASAGVEAQDMNIFRLIERNKKGCVIVINKWDLVEKGSNTMKEYAESIRRRIAPFDDVPIVFTSVLNKQRILDVLQTAMNVYYARIRRIPTSALNEYLLPIIEQTPPPSTKGKYIRIKYVTQLASPTPAFAFFVNLPQYIKEGYRRLSGEQDPRAVGLQGSADSDFLPPEVAPAPGACGIAVVVLYVSGAADCGEHK